MIYLLAGLPFFMASAAGIVAYGTLLRRKRREEMARAKKADGVDAMWLSPSGARYYTRSAGAE